MNPYRYTTKKYSLHKASWGRPGMTRLMWHGPFWSTWHLQMRKPGWWCMVLNYWWWWRSHSSHAKNGTHRNLVLHAEFRTSPKRKI